MKDRKEVECQFQSTHPHEVRLNLNDEKIGAGKGFQSTHPHEVRLIFKRRIECSGQVSIHAPTRGATVCKVTYYKSIN